MEDRHEKTMEATFSILDGTDIEAVAGTRKGEWEVSELMRRLESMTRDEVAGHPELEGCLFNFVNEDEFVRYLEKRYDNVCSTEVTTNYISFDRQGAGMCEETHCQPDLDAVAEKCRAMGIECDLKAPRRRIVEYRNHIGNIVCYEVQEMVFKHDIPYWEAMAYTNPLVSAIVPARFGTFADAAAFMEDPKMHAICHENIVSLQKTGHDKG